ncbi:MAG: ATP synthase F1 subunit delta [Bacteroidota bacterium]
MNHSKISVRYSKTLFNIAKDKNLLDAIKNDMILFSHLYLKSNEFRWLLSTPIVQTSKKQKIIIAMLNNDMNELSLDFIKLVIRNKREQFLPHIARNFMDLYRIEKGIKYLTLKTAEEIETKLSNKIVEMVKKMFDSDVELHSVVDEKIIGGFVITVDDKQLDLSIAHNLKKLEREFINTTFEYKILG